VQVLLDGVDVSTLNVGWLRSHIGVVGQEPVLFDTTIRENIRYGNDSITEEEMIKAAKEANAHDFISKLPEVSTAVLFSYSSRALCPFGIIASFRRESSIDSASFIREVTEPADTIVVIRLKTQRRYCIRSALSLLPRLFSVCSEYVKSHDRGTNVIANNDHYYLELRVMKYSNYK